MSDREEDKHDALPSAEGRPNHPGPGTIPPQEPAKPASGPDEAAAEENEVPPLSLGAVAHLQSERGSSTPPSGADQDAKAATAKLRAQVVETLRARLVAIESQMAELQKSFRIPRLTAAMQAALLAHPPSAPSPAAAYYGLKKQWDKLNLELLRLGATTEPTQTESGRIKGPQTEELAGPAELTAMTQGQAEPRETPASAPAIEEVKSATAGSRETSLRTRSASRRRKKTRPSSNKPLSTPTPSQKRARTTARLIAELNMLKPQMHNEGCYRELQKKHRDYLCFTVAGHREDLRTKLENLQAHHKHIRLAQELAAAHHGCTLSTIQTDWKDHKPRQYRQKAKRRS